MRLLYAVVAAAAAFCLGCGGTLKTSAPKPSLGNRTAAFLQARSQPLPTPEASDLENRNTTEQEQTIDVIGAVDRPGQLVIGPYVQTVRQAVDAMGGTAHSPVMVRIRSGDDALGRLVAEPGDPSTAIEIPIALINDAAPIYVRSGDIVEVVADTAQPHPNPASDSVSASAATDSVPPLAGTATAAELRVLAGAEPVAAPDESSGAAEPPAVEPPPTAAATAVEDDLATLRAEMASKVDSLRRDLAKLQEENQKLRARLGETPKVTASAATTSSPAARKPAPAAEAKRSDSATVEKPMADAREARPAARPATVLVSGSVKNPGAYPIDRVKTVRGAIRAAGDRTDANLQAVEVRPETQRGPLIGIGLGLGSAPARTVVDLTAVDGGKGRDVPLRGGEVIFVPPARASEKSR